MADLLLQGDILETTIFIGSSTIAGTSIVYTGIINDTTTEKSKKESIESMHHLPLQKQSMQQ